MLNDLMEIARFHSAFNAAMARNRLDDAGITARLDGEAMANWFWHFGSSIGGVRLLVNNEDAQRAAAVLASDAAIADDSAIDFGDDSPIDAEQTAEAPAEEVTRAFRASIMGLLLLPPLLNIYSTYLIFRHRLLRPPWNWRVLVALMANSLVFLLLVFIAGMVMTPQEPPPRFHEPDGTPVESFHDEQTIPIRIAP